MRQQRRQNPLGLLVEPREPWEFAHHALLRDCDARLFDALHRHLRLRLYEGRSVCDGGLRVASLRQGPSPRTTRWVLGAGLAGLLVLVLAASGTGTARGARAAHVRLPMAVASAALLGGAAFLAGSPRKHIRIVALPAPADGRMDLWIAAAGRARDFAAEFAAFVDDAAALDRGLQHDESRPAATAHAAPDIGPASLAPSA